jgi:hypothetical protein
VSVIFVISSTRFDATGTSSDRNHIHITMSLVNHTIHISRYCRSMNEFCIKLQYIHKAIFGIFLYIFTC